MTFGIIGISHWQSEVSIREQFYLSEEAKTELYTDILKVSPGVLILDTCNRIEIYAECDPELLIKPLCVAANAEVSFFKKHGYSYKNEGAIDHLFRVGLGLDSQILGDIQIIQQLKKSYQRYEKIAFSGNFHELIQSVFRAHKRTRTETNFASGAASIGYAAAQAASEVFPNMSQVKVLLIGAGKMGKNVSKNLIARGVSELSVINRTYKKAKRLAGHYNISAYTFDELDTQLNRADVIITATGSNNPILNPQHFKNLDGRKLLLIDLSVPRNISRSVKELHDVTLIDMDTIDEVTRKAVDDRKKIVPIVESIIEEEQKNFFAKLKRRELLAPQLEFINEYIDSIAEGELDRIKNKVEREAFEKLEGVTHRIKKKILAFHIQHLEKQLLKDEN